MTDPETLPHVRTVTRLAMAHFLRWVKGVNRNFDGDLVQGIVFIALIQANIAWLNEDKAMAQAFGDMDTPPPDDLRRPVSARALAASLGLPRETVRRQVEKMVARGLCVRDSRSRLLVPTRVLESPQIREMGVRGYQDFTGLIATMRRMDVMPGA